MIKISSTARALLLSATTWFVGGTALAQIPIFPLPESPEAEQEMPPAPSVEEGEPPFSPPIQPPIEGLSPTPAASPIPETPYTLGTGDVLEINIFNVPEVSGQYQVSVDGTLNLPFIGTVVVEDLTVDQASTLISNQYEPILQRPIVNLRLVQVRPLRITIAGEVSRPGAYTLPAEAGFFPKISDAVLNAGGITPSADISNIQLRRVYQGSSQLVRVNLEQLLNAAEAGQDVTLRDGDVLFIPSAETITQAQVRQRIAANFASEITQPLEVAVVGEVFRPGTHSVEGLSFDRPPTVTLALQAAGGITSLSNIRDIEVRRVTRTGEIQILEANLFDLLVEGDLSQDIVLQGGDTIVVPRAEEVVPEEAETLAQASFAPGVIRVNVVGEVRAPGVQEVPANTPLNRAVLAAGGFNRPRARTGSVLLVRLNPDGTVTEERYPVELDADIQSETNPALRNNDTIVVGRNTIAEVSDSLNLVVTPIGRIFQILNFFDN